MSARRRKDVLAVHSMDHFGLQVPSLADGAAFFTAFGLDVRSEEQTLALRAFDNPHCWGRLYAGPVRKLYYLSFGIYGEDEAAFAAHLAAKGVAAIAPPPGAPSDGLWIAGFDGVPLQLRVAPKCSPDLKSRFAAHSTGPGESGAVANSMAPQTRPRRLSHVAIFTTDVIAATHWYEENLGLKLSDGSGPAVAFLHGRHGSDHHLLALVGSTHRGFHHSSWDVASVQEVGLGSAQLMRAGYRRGWGVGRHVLGANYFYYATDPWGSHAEYSADIDYIPADCDWPSAQHAPEDSFYLWGPDVPEGFIDNPEPAEAD